MPIAQRGLPTHWISKWLKEDFKHVYKRRSSRTALSRNPKLKYMQWIFSKKVMNYIDNKKLIFNIDESTFSRSIKCNYSWLPCGKSNAIVNSNRTGRANVTFCLSTDGNWFSLISDKTTDFLKFWRYLLFLKEFINLWMKVDTRDVIYTLYNAPVHVSLKTKKFAEQLDMKLLLLSPYSPSLAPTECVFGASKKKMKIINFSKSSGKMEIAEWLKMIDKNSRISIWMQFFKSVYHIFRSIEVPLLLSNMESEKYEEVKI